MRNPKNLTMKEGRAVTSYTVRLVMGDAEQLVKETVVDGPFAPDEVVRRSIYGDGLAPLDAALDVPMKFQVFGTTANGVTPTATSGVFTFGLDAPTLTLEE